MNKQQNHSTSKAPSEREREVLDYLRVVKWEQDFNANVNVKSMPAARKAWKELSDAELGIVTKGILYLACHTRYYVAASQQLGEVNRRLDALRRASSVAASRRNDPRAAKFAERRDEALQAVGDSLGLKASLAGDAINLSGIGAAPLSKAPALIGKYRQFIRRGDAKFFLAVLRTGAKAHGVTLSPRALAELWLAGAPERDSDPCDLRDTLRRFLALKAIKLTRPERLEMFEAISRLLSLGDNSDAIPRELQDILRRR